MFRGLPNIPTNPCRYCKGAARIKWEGGEHECTSCNGTGIDGEPLALLYIIAIWIVLLCIGGLIWYHSS